MHQSNLYDFLGLEDDPIYIILNRLKSGETVVIEGFHVTKNDFGLLEVASKKLHEVFSNTINCYRYLCDLLVEDSGTFN